MRKKNSPLPNEVTQVELLRDPDAIPTEWGSFGKRRKEHKEYNLCNLPAPMSIGTQAGLWLTFI